MGGGHFQRFWSIDWSHSEVKNTSRLVQLPCASWPAGTMQCRHRRCDFDRLVRSTLGLPRMLLQTAHHAVDARQERNHVQQMEGGQIRLQPQATAGMSVPPLPRPQSCPARPCSLLCPAVSKVHQKERTRLAEPPMQLAQLLEQEQHIDVTCTCTLAQPVAGFRSDCPISPLDVPLLMVR